jgi:KaiC/GvpD/RAD55 family RecA-like ATPase
MLYKIPSGIDSLDLLTNGGFPSGSFILLLGSVGSGHVEFAFTSAVMISNLQEAKGEGIKIPEKICYASFTRSKSDILNEISRTFPERLVDSFQKNLIFKDFSSFYYRRSITPFPWIAEEEPSFLSLKDAGSRSLLEELIRFLNSQASNSLVILDSLTNLIRFAKGSEDLISFLEGMQRASKKWDGLIYGILTSNIFGEEKEEEIADCADGVLVFDWESRGPERRQIMYFKKFRGLLPELSKENILKFETAITPNGFDLINVRRMRYREMR